MKIIGHKKQLDLLIGALLRDHLPHTLLFVGPQGVGKRMVALRLAENILNAQQTSKTSSLFWKGEHPDLHILGLEEDKKDISVEQVRDFISSIKMRPYLGNTRVAIIDDAHLLSAAASNALLLTLEEPPNGCYIILVTHSPQRLLPTILSRSQEISFGSLKPDEIREILELLGCSEELLNSMLNFSDGSFELFNLANLREGKLINANINLIQKEVTKSLSTLNSLNSEIQSAIKFKNLPSLLSLACKLGEKDTPNEFAFRLLIKNIREEARGRPELYSALSKLISLERNVLSRNLNPVIQLSDFFAQNL